MFARDYNKEGKVPAIISFPGIPLLQGNDELLWLFYDISENLIIEYDPVFYFFFFFKV